MPEGTYAFSATAWLYPGEAGWHFITLPKGDAADIKDRTSAVRKGWGSVPVTVTVGQTEWETSIFPDKESDSYLCPIKADVRKREGIADGDSVDVTIRIRRD